MSTFIKKGLNTNPIKDTVFKIVAKAKAAKSSYGEEHVIDATIGSLCGEDGKLIAFASVFQPYNAMDNIKKAKYAESFDGNASYRKQVYHWVVQDIQLDLHHEVIATPGGTGAISMTLQTLVNQDDSILFPELAWESYRLMAEMFQLQSETYKLFQGTAFHLKNFQKQCQNIMEKEHKLTLIINDPCHNPSGYSLSEKEWEEVIKIVNACAKYGPVTVLNDIAYIDYAYDFQKSRRYMKHFNNINDNVLLVVAFSCSKTMTSYGLRCGAALILGKQKQDVQALKSVMEKSARATWSNISNSAMENFTYVTTDGLQAYKKEKTAALQLLKRRSDIFINEAKQVGLMHYPYKEGFFVTLQMDSDQIRDIYHEALMKQHIYTVVVHKGIRIALCSLSIKKCEGLATKLKNIYDKIS
ncbi:MAG: pyridoxal phosphate-dependent aminotransferase [Breznakia sp.]